MDKPIQKPFPTVDQLKQQSRRIRATLAASGHAISHAQALEKTAAQWGARDWNTLCARATEPTEKPSTISKKATPRWQIGQTVRGRYLGHAFDGRIKSATQQFGGFWRLILVFDKPVDVVTSKHFSNFRTQVACTLNSQGVSPTCTSDGEPQMRLFPI